MELPKEDVKSKASAKRAVGRPRADGRPQLKREAVLFAAAILIAEKGYSATSIRMIAETVGAVPASIFNLFSSKDALLNDLIGFVSEPSLRFYRALNALNLPTGVALYKSIFAEVMAVSSADEHLPALFYLPELARPEFSGAQIVREELVSHYRDLISTGHAAGIFDTDCIDLAAEQVFQLTETSIIARKTTSALPVAKQARITADMCLKGLLVDPGQLSRIRDAAHKVDLDIQISEAVVK
jgi:AcrR family transcriptional regulator